MALKSSGALCARRDLGSRRHLDTRSPALLRSFSPGDALSLVCARPKAWTRHPWAWRFLIKAGQVFGVSHWYLLMDFRTKMWGLTLIPHTSTFRDTDTFTWQLREDTRYAERVG